MILGKLKADAEAYLGRDRRRGPSSPFPRTSTTNQRQATKDAGKVAGLDVKRIINEPTAASLAYGLDKEEDPDDSRLRPRRRPRSDVSVLEIGDGVFEVQVDRR